MKETFLHTEDRQKNSDAMAKEVGGREAKESHLRRAEAKKQSQVANAGGSIQDNTSDTPRW